MVLIALSLPVSAQEATEGHINKQVYAKVQPIKADSVPQPQQELAMIAVENKPQGSTGSCEDAIAKIWPAHLQDGARLVAQKESGMVSDRVGSVNSDGSQDFGCFQINNFAHPAFFAEGSWKDPLHSAQYALKIYEGRGNFSAWYAVCTPDRVPKYAGIHCQ